MENKKEIIRPCTLDMEDPEIEREKSDTLSLTSSSSKNIEEIESKINDNVKFSNSNFSINDKYNCSDSTSHTDNLSYTSESSLFYFGSNGTQSINYNVTISAPHMHTYCLEILKDHLKPGGKSLDVGFGSGYLTVAMSKMMGDQGTSVGIEHIKELCDFAEKNINKHNKKLLDEKKVILICGDGRNGCPEYGPYNCIHVGAAAAELPQALINQLANGGRLVIPVGEPGENQ